MTSKITKDDVYSAIFNKYITPCGKNSKKFVGIEIEMPLVNRNGAVDENISITVANGDTLSFDCCYSNLEISFGKCYNINEVNSHFENYYSTLQDEFSNYGYTLTGMGIIHIIQDSLIQNSKILKKS